MINVFVEGRPVPQGSKNAMPGGRGRTNLVESNDKKLRAWQNTIVRAVQDDGGEPLHRFDRNEPVGMQLIFAMPRTSRLPKTDRVPDPPHTVKPDLDKLVRAVGDALTKAEVIGDDAQIDDTYSRKRYARVGEKSGLYLTVHSNT